MFPSGRTNLYDVGLRLPELRRSRPEAVPAAGSLVDIEGDSLSDRGGRSAGSLSLASGSSVPSTDNNHANALPSTRVRGIPVRFPRGRRVRRRHRRPGVRRLDDRFARPEKPDPRHDRHESRGTALAFLLAGVSLWILAGPVDGRVRAVGFACAIGVVLAASLRLGGYLLGWDGGPDRLLFADKLGREAPSSGHPNRMAPNTAAAMLLVGLALIGIGRGPDWALLSAQTLALMTALISLLAIVGYAYSARH